MSIGDRLRAERLRLGLNQSDFAALAATTKKSQIDYEKGTTFPNAAYLAAIAKSGADIAYIVTDARYGTGLNEAAVHQGVIDAVDLLSVAVDADQFAGIVIKLAKRATSHVSKSSNLPTSADLEAMRQRIYVAKGDVAGGDIVNQTVKGGKLVNKKFKLNMGDKK